MYYAENITCQFNPFLFNLALTRPKVYKLTPDLKEKLAAGREGTQTSALQHQPCCASCFKHGLQDTHSINTHDLLLLMKHARHIRVLKAAQFDVMRVCLQ